LLKLFGDRLYIELQRHGLAAERTVEPHLLDLAYARNIALVATNQPYFGAVDDYEAHDALISIAEGRPIADTDRRQLTPEHRFKSRAEMAALFADLPEALASSVEIAERSAFRPKTRTPILPRFTADGAAAADESTLLRQLAEVGLSAGSPRTG
jgi:DNA polymerase III, alpha subunit